MPLRRRALAIAVNLGSFITILDISIVNVALPTMQAALRIDMAGLQWVVDAYALFLSAFMLSAGPWATAMAASVRGWRASCCSRSARRSAGWPTTCRCCWRAARCRAWPAHC
ncbi:hypothetical protein WJ973_15270 [Achromobacter xylosoxidans]